MKPISLVGNILNGNGPAIDYFSDKTVCQMSIAIVFQASLLRLLSKAPLQTTTYYLYGFLSTLSISTSATTNHALLYPVSPSGHLISIYWNPLRVDAGDNHVVTIYI